jgi:hypothetical protein
MQTISHNYRAPRTRDQRTSTTSREERSSSPSFTRLICTNPVSIWRASPRKILSWETRGDYDTEYFSTPAKVIHNCRLVANSILGSLKGCENTAQGCSSPRGLPWVQSQPDLPISREARRAKRVSAICEKLRLNKTICGHPWLEGIFMKSQISNKKSLSALSVSSCKKSPAPANS